MINLTRVVIDSTLYYDNKVLEKNNINIVPLSVNFDNASFKESSDNKKTLEIILDKIDNDKVLPTSSQPSQGDYLTTYEKLINEGAQRIVSIHLSSGISGTYQGSVQAVNMIKEKYPNVDISTFDSQSVAHIGASMALEVSKLGENRIVTDDEVNNIIQRKLEKSSIYFLVDNLDYLSYGGRIPSSLAAVGNIFNLKPILNFKDGKIQKYKTVRSKKIALKTIFDIFEEEVNNCEDTFDVFLPSVTSESEIKKIEKILKKIDPERVNILELKTMGPVIAIHIGPGAVGIGWMKRV